MIKTFDFIFTAKHDEKFMKHLQDALSSNEDSEIHTDIHELFFDAKSRMLSVTPKPNTRAYAKVIPKKIRYEAVIKMLNGKWENLTADDISDI